MKLYLIRHAESFKNIQDRHGNTVEDFPLTPKGIKEADKFSKHFRDIYQISKVITSGNIACTQTAMILAEATSVDYFTNTQLNSFNFGIISGLSFPTVKKKYPEIYKQIDLYHKGKFHPRSYKIPNAETNYEFEKRIVAFLSEVTNAINKNIAVIAHRSSITMILNVINNYPKSCNDDNGFYKVYPINNLSISIVEVESGFLTPRIIEINKSLKNGK